MKLKLAGYIVIFVGGILIGVTFVSQYLPKVAPLATQSTEVRLSGYKYISPLLECESSEVIGETEYKPSITKVNAIIKKATDAKLISYASVYYRDLNNGPWFGINEKKLFTPASLLKVPIMMAFYNTAENQPDILNKKIKYDKQINPLTEYFSPSQTIQKGQTYTIDELINRMIIYSDNYALDLLGQQVNDGFADKVTKDLGINTPTAETPESYISVKNYASLFRVLYNSSYLNANYSEKALELLAKVEFKQGITKGLPENIDVAHKFGERELEDKSVQLHDCGIIYYPNHPYLLCIMTRGSDYKNLSSVIGQISAAIYTDIKNNVDH